MISTCAVPLVRYSGAFMESMINEPDDKKTNNETLHIYIYIYGKEAGSQLASIQESVDIDTTT